jgi:ubiquitin carboxyl-terminal hydrolase BAP1
MSRLGIEAESGKLLNQDDEIHFSLMAVIPHQGANLVRKLTQYEQIRDNYITCKGDKGLDELGEDGLSKLHASLMNYRPSLQVNSAEIEQCFDELQRDIKNIELEIKEEAEKRNKYRLDDARRAHNYDNFITSFLKMLATEGTLESLIRDQLKLSGSTALNEPSVSNGAETQAGAKRVVKRVPTVTVRKSTAGAKRKKKRGRPKKGRNS